MKKIQYRKIPLGIGIVLAIFTSCASSQHIESTAPVTLNEPYFQNWVAGVEGGGYGFHIQLPLEESTDVVLTTAYFRGKEVPLKYEKRFNAYQGHYTHPESVRRDLIMSNDPKEEYGNSVPTIEKKIPFDLKGNECVIAYTKGTKQGFFKLENLSEKEMLAFPEAPKQ